MHKEIKNFPQLSVVLTLRKLIFRGFSGGPVVKIYLPMQGTQI